MTTLEQHLSDELLQEYLLGRLPDAEHVAVEQHLDRCPACENRAAACTPRDPLVKLLAAAIEIEPVQQPTESPVTRVADEVTLFLDASSVGSARESANSPGASSGEASSTEGPLSASSLLPQPPYELLTHKRYRIIRPLGRGGMGTVWLAEHLVMERQVAVKVIRSEWIGKAAALERFKREVKAAAKLKHANVVDAYDAEQIGDMLFLVAEYVDGETLSESLLDGPLPPVEACRAIRDAAHGIGHAHAKGLVHRDVKPGNLIRGRDGIVKVLDFGLVIAPSADSSLTGAHGIVGTPDYVSPEQAEMPHLADARSDLYSLGCTLYHLLSGQPPFPADSTLKKLDAQRYAEPAPLTHVPEDLWQVVSRMMAKNPSNRFQTAQEVSDALAPFCDESTYQDPSEPKPRVSGWRFSRRMVMLAGLGLVGGLAAIYRREFSDRGPTESPANVNSPPPEPAVTRTIPLLVPTSIGDGREEDFQVVDNLLVLDAVTRSTQVWLNFDVARSQRQSIFAKIRFRQFNADANLKLVYLSQNSGEYSLQLRPDLGQIVIHYANGSRRDFLGEHQTKSGFGTDWMNVEFRLSERQLTAIIDDQAVLEVDRQGVADYYPSISALHCQAELLDPRVVIA